MNQAQRYNITCPSCGNPQEVGLYQSIDVSKDREMRLALMENRLNRVVCPVCENTFRIDVPLLYSDPAHQTLIHWIPETEQLSREQILEDFDQSLEELNASIPEGVTLPSVRLVLSRVELVELIFMMEAGMNQRVVEYVKYSIFTRNAEKVPPEKYRLLLNVEDSTDDELCFVMQDAQTQELGSILRYGRAAYQSMCELYEECPDEFREMFPGPCISARHLLLDEAL